MQLEKEEGEEGVTADFGWFEKFIYIMTL